MIQNQFTVLFRKMSRNKSYYAINIIGLSTGFAAVIAIMMFVLHEISYDQYLSKKERIYRVIQGDESDEQSSSVPFPTGPSLMNDYPDVIEHGTRLFNFQASTLGIVIEDGAEKKVFNEPRFFFADSLYFKIFDHKFIQGRPDQSLNGPGKIVITESMANKIFNTVDVIGKVIKFEGTHDLMITAVIEDVPSNAHFKFDYLASFTTLQTIFDKGIPEKNWYWNPVWTYVLLREGHTPAELKSQMKFFVDKYFHPSIKDQVQLVFQPVTDIYLKTKSGYEISPMSDIRYTYIFTCIGVFILIIAIINFVNLSTAQASDRFKEIGIRKVMGARKDHIAWQFLAESFIICFIGSVIGMLVIALLLPQINNISGKSFVIHDLFQPIVIMVVLIATLLCGLLAGIYPALALSALHPSKILKERKSIGRGFFRQILVALQFTVSIILIIGTLIIDQQINFLKSQNLGFNKDQIIALSVQRTKLVSKYPEFREQVLRNKDVEGISTSNTLIGKDFQASNYKIEGKEEKMYPCIFVRNDFLKTMEIPLLAGKDFSDSITAPGYKLIINRALLEEAGWSPEEAIGKVIEGTLEGAMPVVGVCENFNYAPLKQTSGPAVLVQTDFAGHKDFFTRFIYVKVNGQNIESAISFLNDKWREFAEDSPFEFFFLDQNLQQLYIQEERFAALGKVFTIVAIIIGSLGLWGLSAYYVYKRKKEISIRKTLGASFDALVITLSKDFIKPVAAGCIFGIPVVYYFIDKWLEGFAHRTSPSLWMFATGAVVIVVVAGVVILTQLIKGMKVNPAEVLREE